MDLFDLQNHLWLNYITYFHDLVMKIQRSNQYGLQAYVEKLSIYNNPIGKLNFQLKNLIHPDSFDGELSIHFSR